MSTALDPEFIAKYTRGPSDAVVARAIASHTSIRDLLGDGEYATLLQGSYKNDTALADMNDVDIVAVHRTTSSSTFPMRTTPQNPVTWDEIFARIERKLNGSPHYAGKWKREDKCIRVNAEVKVDIVPAVHTGNPISDPIAIYSFSSRAERLNYPRQHYDRSAEKSKRTNGHYKQTVRLMKRWARCWFPNKDERVAPSYYLECLLHFLPEDVFKGELANTFEAVIVNICHLNYRTTTLPRVAGTENIFSAAEWSEDNFQRFQKQLLAVLPSVRKAQNSATQASARSMWAHAFNGYTG